LSRHVKILIGLAGVVTVAAVLSVALRPQSPREQFFGMRPELSLARQAADSCTAALESEQSEFDAFVDRVESFRARIDSLESLDVRGVPADSYPDYLVAVDSFNAIVPDWEAAADSLRTHRTTCEDVVRLHNLLADSARSLAEKAELLDGRGDGRPRP
jgi:hypothetical protein